MKGRFARTIRRAQQIAYKTSKSETTGRGGGLEKKSAMYSRLRDHGQASCSTYLFSRRSRGSKVGETELGSMGVDKRPLPARNVYSRRRYRTTKCLAFAASVEILGWFIGCHVALDVLHAIYLLLQFYKWSRGWSAEYPVRHASRNNSDITDLFNVHKIRRERAVVSHT